MNRRPFARGESSFLTEDDPERLEKEIRERLRQIDSGEVKLIPGEVVLRELLSEPPPKG